MCNTSSLSFGVYKTIATLRLVPLDVAPSGTAAAIRALVHGYDGLRLEANWDPHEVLPKATASTRAGFLVTVLVQCVSY